MRKKIQKLLLAQGLLILLIPTLPVSSQTEQRVCPYVDEPPSQTTRVARLDRLGVEVTIPSNYRTMLRQDGSVEILDPATFTLFECMSRGGIGQGGGYYSQSIALEPRDQSMSFREQAIWSVGSSIDSSGHHLPIVRSIQSYKWHGYSGYIVLSQSGYSATLMVQMPSDEQVLTMAVGCDCEVELEDVISLSESVKPIAR